MENCACVKKKGCTEKDEVKLCKAIIWIGNNVLYLQYTNNHVNQKGSTTWKQETLQHCFVTLWPYIGLWLELN